jgi:hypothetical protein
MVAHRGASEPQIMGISGLKSYEDKWTSVRRYISGAENSAPFIIKIILSGNALHSLFH